MVHSGDKMNKYIVVTFAFMGIGFYELSGGADFEQGDTRLAIFAEPKPTQPQQPQQPPVVARADMSALTDVTPARALIETPAAPEDRDANVQLATLEPDNVLDLQEAERDTTRQDTVAASESGPRIVPAPDFRFVDGDRVNMRGGPGTDYAVVGRLYRNDMVEIIQDEGNGWLHLRDTLTGDEGWIAEWLVTASN